MSNLANSLGTISDVADGLALARVDLGDRKTDWIPVLMMASPFKRHFIPLAIGEQVAVFGGGDGGFAIRGVFSEETPEPMGCGNLIEVIEYVNGNKITVDVATNTLSISGFNLVIDKGNLIVHGTITDNVGTLTDHTHIGVVSGNSTSGGRQ